MGQTTLPEIKCKRLRQCGWQGAWSELVYVEDKEQTRKRGYMVEKQGCPKCGNDEFYAFRQKPV